MKEKIFSRKNMTVLLLFGLIGQIAWTVENMYFNLFVYDTISKNLNAITLMVQLSGVAATIVTLVAGAISDKLGNRRAFISVGYIIWGATVGIFGFISPALMGSIFGTDAETSIKLALITVIVGDCLMTLFGSTANDAAFNAWITDNTKKESRGRIESIISILPLISMLIVAGLFGIIVEAVGYKLVFLMLGLFISISGIIGLFLIKDSEKLEKNGTLKDMIYGFKPSSIVSNLPFYINLIIMCVYGIACQIFMPYIIIYMKSYLGFSVLEYSAVFAAVILIGAVVNLFLGKLSDKISKARALYFAAAIFAFGLILMYFSKGFLHTTTMIIFGCAALVMITGYIFISALTGATARDHTPDGEVGKLQGVRMIFAVLIPMLVGPAIGNAINKAMNIKLENPGADAMTTEFVPAPEIFLAASLITLVIFAIIPILERKLKKTENN